MNSQTSIELIKEYQDLKNVINGIEQEKGKRAMIYSGARRIEEGEKPTRYFFNLNKVRGAKKEINVIQSENNQLITGNKDILNYCKNYFSKLYSRSDSSQNNEDK